MIKKELSCSTTAASAFLKGRLFPGIVETNSKNYSYSAFELTHTHTHQPVSHVLLEMSYTSTTLVEPNQPLVSSFGSWPPATTIFSTRDPGFALTGPHIAVKEVAPLIYPCRHASLKLKFLTISWGWHFCNLCPLVCFVNECSSGTTSEEVSEVAVQGY